MSEQDRDLGGEEVSPTPDESDAPDARADTGTGDEADRALDAAQQAVTGAIDQDLSNPTEEDEAALESARAAAAESEKTAGRAIGQSLPSEGDPAPLDLPVFDPAGTGATHAEMMLLGDVNVDVRIELGRTRMLVEDVLRLSEGAVVELEKLAGDPVDVFVNGRHVARGEVLVLNENFCVRVNEVIEPSPVGE